MLGKELECRCETGNVHDLYTVGIVKMGTGAVGHLLKKILCPDLFIRKGGILYAQSLQQNNGWLM